MITPAARRRRRRPLGRRLLRDLASVLILAGLLLLVDAGVTLVWQEPVTAVIATIQRSQIDRRFVTAPLPPDERYALTRVASPWERISFLARREARQATAGAALGRISIPKLGASFELVQGTDQTSLQKGPGHYPATALPGLKETTAIAGHRTTYLAPFRHLDAVAPGDRIVLRMPYGRFVYAVQSIKVVAPTALWVTRNVGYDRLVLSACTPLYSAAQRLIVFARLNAVVPARL